MKLLIVNTVRFRMNGVTSVIMNYYRNMDRTDMQTDFVVHNEISEEYRQELEGNGSRIFRFPRKKNLLKYMWQMFRLARKERYDVVHIHGNSATMLFDVLPMFLAGVPVRIVHSHNTTCSHMKAHRLLQPIFKHCYTHGFACGEEAGKWLFEEKDFEVIENGIDLQRYAYDAEVRARFRQALNAGDKTVIGHIGNFIEQKNHVFLIDAFAQLLQRDPNYLLVLISDGALMDAMRQKVAQMGIEDSVLFLGKTAQVPEYMQAMDLLWLPSLHEGLPVVLIEAQAAGLPCMVSDKVSEEANLSGALEFLPIEDPAVWADAAQAWQPSDRKADSRLWRERIAARGYDVTQNAQQVRRLYEAYLKAK